MYAEHKHQHFAVYRSVPRDFIVMSGSAYPTSGGTIHSVRSFIAHENAFITDYDVAVVEVSISFNVSIYSEMCITHCCDNQLYLTLLLCEAQFF